MQNQGSQTDKQPAINNYRKPAGESRPIVIEPLRLTREKPALVGRSQITTELTARVERIAGVNLPVLITGPTGAGKEVVARLIHEASPRGSKPFVALNCAAIPELLLESELFGYEKGAFTGAEARTKGKWEAASGGTLLLDEIGDAPQSFQAKILRIIQDGVIPRLGSAGHYSSNVRIIAATNRNLEAAIASGEFREDLYYRLNVITINLPPLIDHLEDIPLLIQHFVSGVTNRKTEGLFSAAALDLLARYNWPGNVRELRNLVLSAASLCVDRVQEARDLPERIRNYCSVDRQVSGRSVTSTGVSALGATAGSCLYRIEPGRAFDLELKQFKLWLINNAIRENGGNILKAAKFLGLTKQALYKRRIQASK